MSRNYSIDLIKIIAMYMVIMLHVGVCRTAHGFQNIPATFTIAGIAIPMFFMVSGYLLSNKKSKDITHQYCGKKIWGIVRFCIIICALFDGLKYLTKHKLEISFPFCLIKEGSFSVFWYFGAMIIIYLCLPLLSRLINYKQFPLFVLSSVLACFVIFGFNYFCSIEEIIPNTFRVLNWITYFLLGAFICKYRENFLSFKWYYPIICCVLFSISVIFGRQHSYELHFSSPLCMMYAISTFTYILQLNIKENVVTKNLSFCFLPVYALHMTIIWRIYDTPLYSNFESNFPSIVGFVIGYTICVLCSTLICVLLMKIPYMNKVFRI